MENEIEKRLRELEKNFSTSSLEQDLNSDFIRQSKLETVAYLKSKLEKMQMEYENALKAKDATIADLKNQIDALHAHIKEIKQHYDKAKEDLLQEQLLQAVKLQETDKILREQKANHAKEVKLLQELLERSRDEIKNLGVKLENLKKEKNELNDKLKKIEIEKMNLEDKVAALENNLSESKKAVEETLGELLNERKLHNDSKRQIKELQNKLEEIRKELENTKLNWDAERNQWRELWERERSVWETHRQEFAIWEERLRSEREAWLERLRQEEEKGVNNVQAITKILEDTSKWSEKVTQILKLYATKGIQLPQVFVTPEVIAKKTSSGFKKVFALTLSAIVFLGSLVWWIYDYKTKLHFSQIRQWVLDDSNYTGLAMEGENILLSHWSKGLILKDKEFKNIKNIDKFSGQNLKISAISYHKDFAWLLDMSQLRFVKIDLNGNILSSISSAGPAPQGLSWDGFNLWSFDASTGLLYKYSVNGGIKGIITYKLKGIKTVDSLQWLNDVLFVLSDGKLYRYHYEQDNFTEYSSQKLKDAFNFYLSKEKLLTFERKGSVNSLNEYKIKEENL